VFRDPLRNSELGARNSQPNPMPTSAQILAWLQRYADEIAKQKDFLTQLDAAIGDADHGANMHRGFQNVITKTAAMVDQDIGAILKAVAMTLISTVGGASGPLYGTFFLQASMAAGPKKEISSEEFSAMLEKGASGVVQRGKAVVGDKTMIDALTPALDALKGALKAGEPLSQALIKASEAAHRGVESTIPLVARKGRASYLGERSAGHQDPGATSSWLLFQAAAETIT
jgi:phosphoenolpyruvate---glycerone phosphotransferase subunit DhaL